MLWRATAGQWLIVDSATDAAQTVPWGQADDVTVPGDYDGDGKADLANFGKDGHWRIKLSGDSSTLDIVWGLGTDVPVPGDYDGDGKTDVAVFRRGGQYEGYWFIKRSSDGAVVSKHWGLGTDVPMPGDYDGDSKADISVWRGSEGRWHIIQSLDGEMRVVTQGRAGDKVVTATPRQ